MNTRRPLPPRPLLAALVTLTLASTGCAAAEDAADATAALAPPPPPTSVDPNVERCRSARDFVVGAARSDITGPVTDISTGYTEPGVTMEGLQMRLYSRAFVIESPCSGKRVAYVNVDVLHTYQSIRTGVLARLATRLPGVYTADNLLIAGTHDHSAPSNISFRTLYNLANGVIGFDRLNYDIVVDGIVDSIVRAHAARTAARIHVARGRLPGAGHNRSAEAYASNPDAAEYDSNVDDTMTLLRFTATNGRPIGVIDWFAAHATSLGGDVHLVDGDNKGYAAWRMEREVSAITGSDFVAGFSNGAMGDVSPNEPPPAGSEPGTDFLRPSDLDPSLDATDDGRIHGARQYEAAMALYESATEEVTGGLFFRHRYVEFQNLPVDPAYGAPAGATTCMAAIGAGFVSGTEEGGTTLIAALHEGDLTYNGIPINPVIPSDLRRCQAEKQTVLPVGDVSKFWVDDIPWVDTIVPLQVFAVGNVAIVGSSFEQTTMQGRRVREVLGATLAPAGVTDVVVAAIANSYNHYLTTREEYAVQHYEGAFTHFGPWSGAAFLHQTDLLARALVEGRTLPAGPTPPDLSNAQVVRTWIDAVGVVNDAPPSGLAFGSVASDAAASYAAGNNRVRVSFWSAHPRTAQVRQRTGHVAATFRYLDVQRLENGAWRTIADDGDPSTRFYWARDGGSLSSRSRTTVEWDLDDVAPGTYRIRHHGVAKRSFAGFLARYESFTGTSRTFTVE